MAWVTGGIKSNNKSRYDQFMYLSRTLTASIIHKIINPVPNHRETKFIKMYSCIINLVVIVNQAHNPWMCNRC